MLKAKENKYVFRRDLKTGSEEACLIFKGNSFQSFGAAAANDLSPPVSSSYINITITIITVIITINHATELNNQMAGDV